MQNYKISIQNFKNHEEKCNKNFFENKKPIKNPTPPMWAKKWLLYTSFPVVRDLNELNRWMSSLNFSMKSTTEQQRTQQERMLSPKINLMKTTGN